jgi:arginine exporter protein ArgO
VEVVHRPVVITALAAGLLAGYGIAVPVGAVAAYLVGLTARTSLRVGVCAALGVASADGLYALIASAGGTALTRLVQPFLLPLRWASAAVLLVLAVHTAVAAARRYREGHPATRVEDALLSPARAYLRLLGITVMNPVTVVYFAALVLGSQATGTPDRLDRAVFVVAAFAASASWQLLLAAGGALLGRVLTGRRARLVTAAVSSVVIAALALHMVLSAASP